MKNLELDRMDTIKGGEFDCDYHMSLGLSVLTAGVASSFMPGGALILFAGAAYSFYAAEVQGCTN